MALFLCVLLCQIHHERNDMIHLKQLPLFTMYVKSFEHDKDKLLTCTVSLISK